MRMGWSLNLPAFGFWMKKIIPHSTATSSIPCWNEKGIAANKPLHELCKEIGALIATEHGIFAASRFLRHSDITTTARHYADHKARITVGLGKYLNPAPVTIAPQATGKAVVA